MKAPSSPPMESKWYFFDGALQHGPYHTHELMSLLAKGLVPPTAKFSCGGPWISRMELEAIMSAGEPDLILLEPSQVMKSPLQDAVPAPPPPSDAQAEPTRDVPPRQDHIPPTAVPTRDRIVIIGRRAAGKTVYLAALYQQLWKSRDGLCMKALSGRSHKELMGICETLRRGEWPPATERTTVAHTEFELQYRHRKQVLVALDYAGEVFQDAFVNDDMESPQARALISHIDRAVAVILLVDPSVAASGDAEAFVDDDYGIVQAIQRIRDWPGGEDVPVVLLFTKFDQNRQLFAGKGSIQEFVKTHYPALCRTLHRFKVFHASAVQTVPDGRGRMRPKADSIPVNVVESLKYCLDKLEAREERKQIEEQQAAERRAIEDMARAQEEAERRYGRRFFIIIASIITIAICAMILILLFKG